jgi:hypothetical protein
MEGMFRARPPVLWLARRLDRLSSGNFEAYASAFTHARVSGMARNRDRFGRQAE